MEVLTTYSHRQLGASLNNAAASCNMYGAESPQACGTEASLKQSTTFPVSDIPSQEKGPTTELAIASEDDLERSQNIEEKNSEASAGDVSISSSLSKSTKKDKEKAQIEYLLSSLPAVSKYFKVHGKIGEGTFSSVFLASLKEVRPDNAMANRQFAVKHLIPTTHPSRAERELKCLQDIGGCDNVVGIHFCMRNNDSIAFIMPYLPHKRFHEYVMEMGVAETRNYMKQLLLALRRVHSFNIIHRDVKPSNFLYDRETKQFLLVDFGLSQPVEETSRLFPTTSSRNEECRKRKREKEPFEDIKASTNNDVSENPAKRPALASKSCSNIMKTPEKDVKLFKEAESIFKPNAQITSNRATRLMNITNKSCSNAQRLSAINTGIVPLKSPAKEVMGTSQGRKTPRKSKPHADLENISPFKCDNQNLPTRPSRIEAAGVWKDKLSSSNEKQALDLRKGKPDPEPRLANTLGRSGQKSSLQRKILFDDISDDGFKRNDKSGPRMPLMQQTNQLSPRVIGHSATLPMKPAWPNSSSVTTTVCDPLSLSPVDQAGSLGKEFRTLAPETAKDDFAGPSLVRVQNSQVKSQQMSPVTPKETRSLKVPYEKINERDQKVIFAKPQAPSVSGSMHRTNTTSSPHCNCVGRLQVCSVCLSRKPHNAPRAGTPGFRPPEVLLRSPIQSTAVDMWAVGVILLCILSGCYPFFRSPDDLTALAEIMTVFGTDKIKETAMRLGRMVVCTMPSQPLDLKKLCLRMRQRRKDKTQGCSTAANFSTEKCKNCCQQRGDPDNCICLENFVDALEVNPHDVNNKEESDNIFPDSAYHLLARLLDLDADTRITAAQALEHPFVTG